ncbi:hypothetical protein OAC89_01435 [Deltaproteobacteria bacterium]|nr:hypothetical protein [Deltaproteobacteria bacterium]
MKKNAKKYQRQNDGRRWQRLLDDAVTLTKNCVYGNETNNQRGFRFVERRPIENKYVVFSDHHYLPRNNRHSIFTRFGNRGIYMHALHRYAEREYTLVEAGDVEDLVVFEPTLDEAMYRAGLSWDLLRLARLERRRDQLRTILLENSRLYNLINDEFKVHDRYVKLAGNHDLDLQEDSLLRIFPDEFNMEIHDFLALHRTTNRGRFIMPAQVAVAHGHQFDFVCHPQHMTELGETYTEVVGWAFQGCDRYWRWNDGPAQWIENKPFRNVLASGKTRPNEGITDAVLEILQDGHEIAWEYFENPNVNKAFSREFITGEEMFKFRHLSETDLRNKLSKQFPNRVNSGEFYLVLGHTHEPRLNPVDPKKNIDRRTGLQITYPYIVNCGTAGRFQNLVWALEIDHGNMRIVAWHRPGNRRNATPLRMEFVPRRDMLVATTTRPVPDN